jgi:hypothetical protein
VIPIPSGAKKVARCFSTAKNNTDKIKAHVMKHSIKTPCARLVSAPKAGVTAKGPGNKISSNPQAAVNDLILGSSVDLIKKWFELKLVLTDCARKLSYDITEKSGGANDPHQNQG